MVNKAKLHKFVRKSHRYLGIFIGIQFLAWTVGGLYFSWVDMDEIHSSDIRNAPPRIKASFKPAPLDSALEQLRAEGLIEIRKVELTPLSEDQAVFRIDYYKGDEKVRTTTLVDASTGEIRPPLSESEAMELARETYRGDVEIESVRSIEESGPHDEFREFPLPMYAVEMVDGRDTIIYVSPKHARVMLIRNNQWRVFDFLWMLHTMDYESRDNFSNWLIRSFSILGLITISSGFLLFFLSSPLFRKKKQAKQ